MSLNRLVLILLSVPSVCNMSTPGPDTFVPSGVYVCVLFLKI